MKYSIWKRYETWCKNGKEFTNWFLCFGCDFFDDESDAIKEINIQKTNVKNTEKVTKLKHEFEVRYIDIDELPKPKPKRPRGRPKKNIN
jgi:hypothetical protein